MTLINYLWILTLMSVIVFCIANLVFLFTLRSGQRFGGKTIKEMTPTQTIVKDTTKEDLIQVLKSLGITHNTKQLAERVIKENPNQKDVGELTKHCLNKLTENFNK